MNRKVVFVLMALVLIVGCGSQQGKNREDWETYTVEKFEFSVSYPKNLSVEEDLWEEPTEESLGTPDGGIDIYFDENNYISVYGALGHIGYNVGDDFEELELNTDSGLEGVMYREKEKDENNIIIIYYLIEEESIAATAILDDSVYEDNEEIITQILKSISLEK